MATSGSVVFVPHLETLVVRQTDDVIEEIDQLLEALQAFRRGAPNRSK